MKDMGKHSYGEGSKENKKYAQKYGGQKSSNPGVKYTGDSGKRADSPTKFRSHSRKS